jgi:hypothetical protein
MTQPINPIVMDVKKKIEEAARKHSEVTIRYSHSEESHFIPERESSFIFGAQFGYALESEERKELIRSLQSEIERLREFCGLFSKCNNELVSENARLKEKLEKVVKSLEYVRDCISLDEPLNGNWTIGDLRAIVFEALASLRSDEK